MHRKHIRNKRQVKRCEHDEMVRSGTNSCLQQNLFTRDRCWQLQMSGSGLSFLISSVKAGLGEERWESQPNNSETRVKNLQPLQTQLLVFCLRNNIVFLPKHDKRPEPRGDKCVLENSPRPFPTMLMTAPVIMVHFCAQIKLNCCPLSLCFLLASCVCASHTKWTAVNNLQKLSLLIKPGAKLRSHPGVSPYFLYVGRWGTQTNQCGDPEQPRKQCPTVRPTVFFYVLIYNIMLGRPPTQRNHGCCSDGVIKYTVVWAF